MSSKRHPYYSMKPNELTKEVLENLLLKQNFTTKQISEQTGINLSTIQNRLNKFGIRKPTLKDILTKELLEKLYIKQGLSSTEIGKIYNCSSTTVLEAIKNHGIKLKSVAGSLSKELLEDLYQKKGMTVPAISKQLGISETVIYDKLKSLGMDKTSMDLKFKAEVERLYIQEDLSQQEVVDKLNSSVNKVSYILTKYKIKKKTQQERFMENPPSKEELENYYVKQGLNVNEVARKYNVHYSFVQKILVKYGISKTDSNLEASFKVFLDSLDLKYETGVYNIIPNQELDIYFPGKNLAIELNGVFWHSAKCLDRMYHQKKSLACKEKGIRLIHIFEDEWVDSVKQPILKDLVRHILGLSSQKIYARNCEIQEIDSPTYNDFCICNHIQGTGNAIVKLGLYYKDKLVQIASFSKSRFDKNYEWEWIRGCPASNNSVIGGTSKLFKYFVKKFNPNSVVCYADFNKFNGQGYKECGFKEVGLTSPDKFYVENNKSMKRLGRNPSKYQEYKKLVEQNKLYVLYGAGNLKFAWEKK